jgi:hypothetical protein
MDLNKCYGGWAVDRLGLFGSQKSNTYDLRLILLQLMSVFISSQSPAALQP